MLVLIGPPDADWKHFTKSKNTTTVTVACECVPQSSDLPDWSQSSSPEPKQVLGVAVWSVSLFWAYECAQVRSAARVWQCCLTWVWPN